MINERAVLNVRRDFKRPEPASVKRFAGAATVHLVDAMGGRGGLDCDIKAIHLAASAFVGPALTCQAGADDSLAILAARFGPAGRRHRRRHRRLQTLCGRWRSVRGDRENGRYSCDRHRRTRP
jgi:hypothetical protein